MHKRTTLGLLLSTGLSCAFAGTMGAAEVKQDFSGLYWGLGTGSASFFYKDAQPAVFRQDTDSTSFVEFEGHLGYGRYLESRTYLGLKGSVYYTPLELSHTRGYLNSETDALKSGYLQTQATIKPIYNIDAVLGYEIVPHVLPFIEGGVSFANINTQAIVSESLTQIPGAGTAAVTKYNNNASGYKTGYNLGIGSSYQPLENWFFSGELVYNYLGKYTNNYQNGPDLDQRSRTYQLVSLLVTASHKFANI